MATTPGQGPLTGVRVVELAGIGPGPFAAMLLADLGADVVRVDRPGGPGLAIDAAYDITNRNKRSVVIDLKSADGAARVLDLAARADILIEGYRPGVAERLGVGPEDCHARNPALVYGRMTGWGQEGPLAHRAGHDIAYIAVTGALGMIGSPDEPPAVPANLLGDYAGGSLYLVVGVLAALLHARATGGGQVVDAAIVDGTSHLAAMIHGMLAAGGWQDRRGANLLDGGCPYYGTYETADGGYMAVGALEPQFYAEFLGLLGLTEFADARKDWTRWGELREAVTDRFKSRTRAEWTAVFEDTDACVAPVLSLREAPHHPHLAARGTFTEHGGITQPAPAPRFSVTPTAVRTGPARPGADTAEVARDWGVRGLPGDPGGADTAATDAEATDRPDLRGAEVVDPNPTEPGGTGPDLWGAEVVAPSPAEPGGTGPDLRGAEVVAPSPAEAGGVGPDLRGAEVVAPNPAETGGVGPDLRGAEVVAPSPAETGGVGPDLRGAEVVAPNPAETGGTGPDLRGAGVVDPSSAPAAPTAPLASSGDAATSHPDGAEAPYPVPDGADATRPHSPTRAEAPNPHPKASGTTRPDPYGADTKGLE